MDSKMVEVKKVIFRLIYKRVIHEQNDPSLPLSFSAVFKVQSSSTSNCIYHQQRFAVAPCSQPIVNPT